MAGKKTSADTMMHRLVEEKLNATDRAQYDAFIKMTPDQKDAFIAANYAHLNPCDPSDLNKAKTFFDPLLSKCISRTLLAEIIAQEQPIQNSIHNVNEFFILLRKIEGGSINLNIEQQTRITLPYYLMMGEGIYAKYVNLTILMLVQGGIPFYRLKNGNKEVVKKISTYGKIEKETLGSKLAFLDSEGCKYITNLFDRRLRNSIAHMSYTVFPDGSVEYKDQGAAKTSTITNQQLIDQIEDMINFANCAWEAIHQYLLQWATANKLPAP